ncbi:DC-STAMP domain-containing protein 1-like [Acanthaster planci]|uniref:DC-STAMP domain-containing protein 1-like n=1 Tax=Acanthaster planci TaxID=133434 RepID=A0A8B7Y9U9_ACAPL|nr:DC-STAMP domain-containing protein 1-like [Acanthaster planci]
MSCLIEFFDYCVPDVKRAVKKICPCLYRIIWGETWEFVMVKTVLGFAFGGLLGAALYFFVINRITALPPDGREAFGAVITLVLAAGFALSLQLRCIMILVLPNFFGRHGRSLLASFAFVLLLSGPVNNIVRNSKESARAISCTSSLTFNHSRELFLLLHKPFTDAFQNVRGRSEEIEREAKNVQQEFLDFEDEVEGNDVGGGKKRKYSGTQSPETLEKAYNFRNAERCEYLFDKGMQTCKRELKKMEDECFNQKKGLFQKLFCLPLKFERMCNLVNLFRFICKQVPEAPSEFGEMYLTLRRGIHSFDTNFKVDLRWQMTKFPDILNGTSITEVRARMAYEMRVRKQWFEAITALAKIFLSFMFILVFKSASNYSSKYLTNVSFDNVYLTAYFRKIDARRRKQNKRTLLPQKKSESNDIIEAARWKLRREEKKSMVVGTVRLLMQVIVSVILVFFDSLFYNMLDLIRRHSHVDFTFKGEHALRIGVLGNGIIAKLFKKVLSAFDQHHAVNKLSSNKQCLPRPHQPDQQMIIMIFGVLGGIWLLLYFQAYGLRLRRVICAYFYPKKEKQRVLFLYNDLLKKRVGFLKYMRLKVRQLAREKKLADKIGTLRTLRTRCPRLCCWLALCKLGRRKCLVCEDYEGAGFQECPTEGCDFIYCKDCWKDVKMKCYACKVYASGSDDDFFSDD